MVDDLSAKPTNELVEIRDQAARLVAARYASESAPARAVEARVTYLAELDRVAADWWSGRGGTGTPATPVSYVAPRGPHETWPTGSVVTHAGKTWLNTAPANDRTPGTPDSGWTEENA